MRLQPQKRFYRFYLVDVPQWILVFSDQNVSMLSLFHLDSAARLHSPRRISRPTLVHTKQACECLNVALSRPLQDLGVLHRSHAGHQSAGAVLQRPAEGHRGEQQGESTHLTLLGKLELKVTETGVNEGAAVFTGGRIYEGVLRQEFPMDGRSHFRLQGRGLGCHHVGVSMLDSEKIKMFGGCCDSD